MIGQLSSLRRCHLRGLVDRRNVGHVASILFLEHEKKENGTAAKKFFGRWPCGFDKKTSRNKLEATQPAK